MTNEIRNAALNTILPVLKTAFPNAVEVVIGKKTMLAVPTGQYDDEGEMVYATIDTTVKDNKGTATRAGFSLDAAIAASAEKADAAAKRAAKPKATPKTTEAAVKREARMVELRKWWNDEAASGVGYTSTMVRDALSDVYSDMNGTSIMTVGSDLKRLSEEMPTECEMRVEDGKKHYYKA